MSVNMSYVENVKLALQSIISNKLRTFLTALIIAIGIMALIGVLTSIDAIQSSLTNSFSSMGSNSFNIRNRGVNVRIGDSGSQAKVFPSITYQDALDFKRRFDFDAVVSLSANVTWGATAKYKAEKTNPNIGVLGVDENYLQTSGYKLEDGRNLTAQDVDNATSVVIIGQEVKSKLFKNNKSPVGEYITLGGDRFTVVGVLESKGSSAGFGADKACFVPLSRGRAMMGQVNPSYTITVMTTDPFKMDGAEGEAIATFRKVRGLNAKQTNDFEIVKSDAVAQILMQNLALVTVGAIVIAFITLVGASIGLMNIMLVSVTERTREIGVRKAIGATPTVIRKQFLMEAIVICVMGGIAGIVLGIAIGNLLALTLGADFIVPWKWMLLGLSVCVGVGMISGYYPASKASKLDPVEALRYE
ncbi:putative ABC transport system permease protein [Sphingobacterium allocomposti]|jgi:putative ABC transport system permease protein|uniref:Putative ABC transport system permease protein n=1 Tax=Sphingobacterium allocomposti TaxID=415956 RepID=A0A5S5D9U5_9SPHI|nr:ABC transporter permease [Sphingobacterium composti Yoo et al. 2007 non Ten et al. 2007]TYP91836.1 putative ABC transport system permease protein [Sphingobacterium composti Yoo et al. 2007 non Ten et al. 2007]HLS95673.1 ABC transporter permease [Sphingobacterium sp.]